MISETVETTTIRLDGDWSMSGVAEKFPVLEKCLRHLLDSEASGERQKSPSVGIPEIDLAGVTDFDACGCQLLALFVRSLRQNGSSPLLLNMSEAFISRVHSLGFGRELNLPL
ncbi:MAG: STAS domain-containing protein [Steroidobacteraceae bacterium]|nr:STAS domain-containing protein [Deltaproteobacteria bacterium]